MSKIILPKNYQKIAGEAKIKKNAEIELKHKQKADYLLENHVSKLISSMNSNELRIVSRMDIPEQKYV